MSGYLKTYRRGVNSEKIAAFWLRLKGYKILEQRYKTKMGEIDIIATKGNLISFVEVKARPTAGLALESVTPKMRRRIQNTALHFVAQKPSRGGLDLRFDVVCVMPFSWKKLFKGAPLIHHLDNAWQAEA